MAGCAVPWKRWKTNILPLTAMRGVSSSLGEFGCLSWCFWPRSNSRNFSFLVHPPSMGSCSPAALVAFLNINKQLPRLRQVREDVAVQTTDDPGTLRERAWCKETTSLPSPALRSAFVCIKISYCSACLTPAKWLPSIRWCWNNLRFHYTQTVPFNPLKSFSTNWA